MTRSIASLIVAGSVFASAGGTMAQWQPKPMSRAVLDGVQLDYDVRGAGEPVVLVHAGIFAEWFRPLVEERALTDRHRVVTYHRVGYAGSSRVAGPVSIADQATHLRALMRHLGIERAHLVGHSSGGNIALQLALDAPQMVRSLVLMEAALAVPSTDTQRMLSTRAGMAPTLEAFRAGHHAVAVDGFMRAVAGPDYRPVIDRVLPGAFEQAVRDAPTFFGQELPAVQKWAFTQEDARRITQPALAIIGGKSKELSPIWEQRQALVLGWLPHAEGYTLPGATHLLHVEQPRVVAETLAAFFARHPVSGR